LNSASPLGSGLSSRAQLSDGATGATPEPPTLRPIATDAAQSSVVGSDVPEHGHVQGPADHQHLAHELVEDFEEFRKANLTWPKSPLRLL